MDFLDLAKNRYSVRSFKPDKVPCELIDKIIEAGMLAPTARNNQPVKIIVVTSDNGLERFRKCTNSHFEAPLALIVGYDKNISWTRPYDMQDSGYVDASIVGTHLMLEAANLGLGSTWVMNFVPDAIKTEFNFPENYEPVVVFPMGYPSDDAQPSERHTQCRKTEEMVSFE